MKRTITTFLSFVIVLTTCLQTGAASPVILTNAPAYTMYHGCGPTSAAMIFGYWALRGYSNLFDAKGDALFLTANVTNQISSPTHILKYEAENGDNPILPIPPYTSIADYLGTSVDPLPIGETSNLLVRVGMVNYAAYKGYSFQIAVTNFNVTTSWALLKKEINEGRPMLFTVDGVVLDGKADHIVPVIGFDDGGTVASRRYACYTTRLIDGTNIVWYKFQKVSTNTPALYSIEQQFQIMPEGPLSTPKPKLKGTLIMVHGF